jgi:amino acid adenylation domain-containing protein
MSYLIHEYLDSVADANPGRYAAWFLDDRLTYGELTRRSNQLARTLIDRGVARHDRVGIYMDKSINTPVAMYGIMKAGAAYVPLDPASSPDRVLGVIRDCGIRHLVSAASKLRKVRGLARLDSGLHCIVGLDHQDDLPFECIGWDDIGLANDRPVERKVIESDLAYIIYTSGSTGSPKGIMHTHYSGLSFARWAVREYGLHADDRLSNHAPLHFDLSIFDYFAAVVAGAGTVIIPEEHTKLPASYSQLLADHAVTVLFTVPFALIQMSLRGSLDKRDLRSLRWAIFGGEPFPPNYLRDLMRQLPHVKFDNMYGPAEVNGCTHYTITEPPKESIPIGPIADCAEALIVDKHGVEVCVGAVGELLVRTPTMMQGYWQRKNLNDQAFYRQVSEGGRENVFFRTGDLVQELDDGNFRFVGRKDRQVKVRGYRVELDEVELALASTDGVEEAAAYLVEDHEGAKLVGAQVTLQSAGVVDKAEVLGHLKKRLPWYAVPADLRISTEFPRTRTGKIDRRALAAEARARLRGLADGDIVNVSPGG